MPSRANSLPAALNSIIHQVDRLYLYLDKFDAVPEIAKSHSKIIPVLHHDFPELHSDGKFVPLLLEKNDDFVLIGPDDDIVYPRSFVSDLSKAINRNGGGVVAGVHGVKLKLPFDGYVSSRDVYHFAKRLNEDVEVDILGSGTILFETKYLRFDPREWKFRNVTDLTFALEAEKRRLKRIAVRRGKNYLKSIEENQEDSIWRKISQDDSIKTLLSKQLLKAQGRA